MKQVGKKIKILHASFNCCLQTISVAGEKCPTQPLRYTVRSRWKNEKKNKSLQAGFNCCQQLLQKAGLTGSLKLTGVPLVVILCNGKRKFGNQCNNSIRKELASLFNSCQIREMDAVYKSHQNSSG